MISRTLPKREKGVVLVLVALGLIAMMGMAALAIDLSHAYVNKTRLQNLADAMALSAAISLNKQEFSTAFPDKEAYAENYAKTNTFSAFELSSGNKEIADALAATDFTFTFAVDWSSNTADWKVANAIAGARFARVTVTPMNIATWFGSVIGFNSMVTSVSSVAGGVPIKPSCNDIVPMMMCAQTNNPNAPVDAQGARIDKNCFDNNDNSGFANSNNDCFGYEKDVVYATKESKWQLNDVGPGNFGFFDVGSGGSSIRDCLAGDPGCTSNLCSLVDNAAPTLPLTSEPGNKVGPTQQGLNTRFDSYVGSINYPTVLPDSIVNHSLSSTAREVGQEFNPAKNYTSTSAHIYNSYYRDNFLTSNDLSSGHSFTPGRRLTMLPFVACPGNTNGKKDLEIVGFGCWFLTSATDGQTVYAEFLGASGCNVSSKSLSITNFGIYKVMLYKDPFGGHS